MIVKKAELVRTAVEPGQYPDTGLPEFVLAGRSNVGKSSFINAMTNRKIWQGQPQHPVKPN